MVLLFNLLPMCVFAGLIIYDLRKSRDLRDTGQLVRVFSCLLGIVLSFSGLFSDRECQLKFLAVDVGAVDIALLASPFLAGIRKNGIVFPVSFMSSYVLLVALLPLFSDRYEDFGQSRLALSCLFLLVFVLVFLYEMMKVRLSDRKALFREESVLDFVDVVTSFAHAVIFFVLLCCLLCAVHMKKGGDLATGLLLVSFTAHSSVLYHRSSTGWSNLIPREKEARIREMVEARSHAKYPDKVTDDARMNALYGRIRNYMSEKEPYLDSSFCMGDMSRDLYSNKLYLSRTINTLSGRNFRQFVNYYRIEHAKVLFHSDPRIRVSEVAEKSGFNTTVSFNIAFKSNTGQTPSAWLQDQALPFS